MKRRIEMTRFRAFMAAMTAISLLGGCGNQGKSADAPATIQVTPGDTSVVVSFAMDPGVEYWVFSAPSSSLNSTNFTTVLGGRATIGAISPQVISGLLNGTTYYFTINGRTNGGPGGPG